MCWKMEKYEQIAVVGEGSYGLVMKCRHRETDQIVAVKKFLETEEDANIRKMALREIRMLKRLKHENLVTMIEVFRYRKRFYIVFEYLEGTILDELEKMPGGLGDERCRERIFQVVRAVGFCHGNNIIHRDVKPENVLVSSLGVVKLCDFGFARIVGVSGEICTDYVATRWYRAPELLVGEPSYGTGIDIWAIGCLFAEMMTGDPLFPGESDIDQFYLIVKMLGKPCFRHQQLMAKNELLSVIKAPTERPVGLHIVFSSWSPQSIDFLNNCIKMDPQERFSADELLRDVYFTHDRFPQRFLPALREKVNIEFNSPLLCKFKTEIFMSTDKKEEMKRSFQNQSRWRFTLTEGSMKRKFSCDTLSSDILSNKNLITPQKKSTEKINVTQKNAQNLLTKQSPLSIPKDKVTNLNTPKLSQNGNNTSEIRLLEKSLDTLVKFHSNSKSDNSQPLSVQNKGNNSLLPEPPPSFQSVHFGLGDYNKFRSSHAVVLYPSINNISFNKDPPKRSPKVLHSVYNAKVSQVSVMNNPKTQFSKKLERNIVMENIFANGDQGNQSWNNAPLWLSNISATNLCNNKNVIKLKMDDDFCLPNLPGATAIPNKTTKKSLLEMQEPNTAEISPDYRYMKAKRKRNTLDISIPLPVNEKD